MLARILGSSRPRSARAVGIVLQDLAVPSGHACFTTKSRGLVPNLTDLVSRHGVAPSAAKKAILLQAIDESESIEELYEATKSLAKADVGHANNAVLVRVAQRYAQLCENAAGASASKSRRRLRRTILQIVRSSRFSTVPDLIEVLQ